MNVRIERVLPLSNPLLRRDACKVGLRRTFRQKSPTWEERLADAVTPLWRLNYEEQLQLKVERQQEILRELSSRLSNTDSVPLLPIIPSPLRNGYRNKSTFSVNKGVDGNPKTVGFYIGTGKSGNVVCVGGGHLLNMPEKHALVARCYEDFIRQSPLRPCIVFSDGGHWREVTVRTTSAGGAMAIVYFHPQDLTREQKSQHKAKLVEYFARGPGSVCRLDSLYLQESAMTRCSHQDSPYQLLYGQPHIHEELLGFRFRISADAFFQVNTAAAAVLYRTVGELTRVSGGETLLDVCCGTGAIGISLSSKVKRVIGIEVMEQAVEDARHNAETNGVRNCEFLSGKAEAVLPKLMPSLDSDSGLTAVVNPSRAGLHYRIIRALRNHLSIRRLVYISCKPDGEAMRNFVELCCSRNEQKKLTGEPFTLTLAVPVDMFPHTTHCELLLVFER
ncbi:tRNA (uracil-5-)-methyltransferase homolog B [Denticeps clupeoides]|uniref:tRNA (uracil-5-)-methyltransferase homolog B n=1 Tax=Denticeps clupeoides TaxID=299321 RepID=UPI0010A44FF0|nr:tRNA (uracil(54)-C(5))-methyltransferase homolog [Denticeps clupeoides]